MTMAFILLISGIALFIFAMGLAEDALKSMAGRQFKKFLQNNINTPSKAIAAGAIVTGILQSSSVVSLMTLSFVGAGLINMRNALAVTLGANLGTTFASWVIATVGFKFEIISLAYALVILSVVTKMAFKKIKTLIDISNFLMGFALLFVGLEWMKESASVLVSTIDLSALNTYSPYWFIVFGLILTVIIQSSSATTAITLTALFNHAINFDCAIGILIGSEVGTTVKIFFGAMGGIQDKKRVALGNLFFNITLLLVATVFLKPISNFIFHLIGETEPLIGLVTFQTGMNLFMIILFLPFMGKIGDFLEKQYLDSRDEGISNHLNTKEPIFSEESMIAVRKEIDRFLTQTIQLNSLVIGIKNNIDLSWYQKLMDKSSIDEKYNNLKLLQGEILQYLVDMRSMNLKKSELNEIGRLITVTRSIMHAAKKIKDVRHNFEELEASANDVLYDNLTGIRTSEKEFLLRLFDLKSDDGSRTNDKALNQLREFNDLRYNITISETLNELDAEQIKEFDSSTLLNIHRAIHASNKSLIDVLEDLQNGNL